MNKKGVRRAARLEHVGVELYHPFTVGDVEIHLAFRIGGRNVRILLVGGNIDVFVDGVVVAHNGELEML